RLIELMKERGSNIQEQVVGITHADNLETALEVKELIEDELHPKEIYISSIGSAIGSHTGAGTIALFFLNAQNE
ncbi:DegV family protein, partial [Bacillus sp. MUM 116]|uniref:DegV family protein n=1 Tax=Bacillus sp. MUM 116 TaxID=1678002 RepID=UPI000B0B4D88